MGPAPIGARRKRRRIPCSRKVTSCTLSPQKLPITVIVSTAPRIYAIQPACPLARTNTKKNRKPSGMTKLKNKKVRLRIASRMRIVVNVQVFLSEFASIILAILIPGVGGR